MSETSDSSSVPSLRFSRVDHMEGLVAIEDELWEARAALQAGQEDLYKRRLQSAVISLNVLLHEKVR